MSDFSSQNSNSINFAAALSRAKLIAAKIHTSSGQGTKRQFEDEDSDSGKRFSGSDSYGTSNSPTGMSGISSAALQAAQAAAQVSARLSTQNPNQSNPDAVQKARDLISKMIPSSNGHSGGGMDGPMLGGGMGGGRPGMGSGGQGNNQGGSNFTEIMVPGAKVGLIIGKGGETIKQLQEKTGAKMVIIQDGPGQEMEKPLRISGDPQKVEHAKKLVYDLIADKGDGHQGGHQGGGRPNNNFGSGGDQVEIFVPKAAVGVIIGKGGDMIKKIQGETGCKLQFIQEFQGKDDAPGDRRCLVSGSKSEMEDGKHMIEDLIESVLRRAGGGDRNHGGNDHYGNGGGYNSNNSNGSGGGVQVQVEQYQFVVPASKCGIIIGRGGDTIKQINQQSGAYCEMDRKTSANQTVEKTFTVKGEQHQVDEAKRLIYDKINIELNFVHLGTSTQTQQAPSQNYGQSAGGPAYQAWGGNGGSGGYQAQSWDQGANQAQPQMGGPGAAGQGADYSQQWIEYYRQMGMHREAEMIEQQVKTKQTAGGAAGSMPGTATPSSNGAAQPAAAAANQTDYSAEWAEYYRRLGKTEEAEAIEKQISASKQAPAAGGAYQVPGQAAQNPQMAAAAYQYQHYYGQQQAQAYQYQQYGAGAGGPAQGNDKN